MDNPADATPGRGARPAARIGSAVGLGIGVLGVVFVVRTLVTRSDEVSDAFARMDAASLGASLVLGLGAMAWIGVVWTRMLDAPGRTVPRRTAMAWYFTGQLGKYVPGGIWPVVGRSEMAVRGGVPRPSAYGATALSMVTTYLAACAVAGCASLLSWTWPALGAALLVAAVVAVTVIASERVRAVALARPARRWPAVGRLVGGVPVGVRTRTLVAAHVPAWILVSASTWVVARTLGADIGAAHLLFATTAAWLAGFVVVGVPGGIGVREAAFVALTTSAAGTSVAVAVTVTSRAVFIVVDLVGAAVAAAAARGSAKT